MENRFSQLRTLGLIAALAALMLALCAIACPATAMADATVVAHSGDGDQRVEYHSYNDAVSAGYEGKTIVMDADWSFNTTQGIHGGKSLTIDMNGHRITGVDGASVFHLYEGATLKLQSSVEKVFFFFDGFDNVWGSKTKVGLYSGGLVTGGQTVHGGGIYMEDRAHLVLDNVAVAGNSCKETTFYNANGGGVYTEDDCTVDIQNNAKIQYNYSEQNGGGVSVHGERTAVNINGATICKNYAKNGGGLYSGTVQTHVNMTNNGSITENVGSNSGGGMTFSYSYFFVKSDGTGVISHNKTTVASGKSESSLGGGGINVIGNSTNSNEGEIEGVRFEYNRSNHRAGALYLGQEWTKVINCTFTSNSAARQGGAIYNNNDHNVVSGCTFRENSASSDGGAIYIDEPSGTIIGCTFEKNHCGDEGGAVYVNDNLTVTDTTAKDNWCTSEGGAFYVAYRHDVKMTGKCIIKDNTRGEGSNTKDDVFLNHLSGGGGKAYITGSLSTGSSVGVRTGYEDDRRIAKSFKPETKDCLFYDMDGYYVSYGSDENGDAWQRHTTKEFTVSIDGKAYGKYRNGSAVALAAPATKDGKAFWHWDTGSNGTTGLYPLGDYISDKGLYSNAVAFTMPQNDVNLVPLYINRVTAVRFQVQAPEADQPLPTSGKLWRSDGGMSAGSAPCSVYWYEVDEGGNVSETSATGLAKANTAYKAYLVAPEAAEQGLFYDKEISAAVSLVSASGDFVCEPKVTDSHLTLSNSVAAHVAEYTTGAGTGNVETGTVEVQLKNKGLLGEGEANAVALMADGDAQADDTGAVDTVQISYAYSEDTDTVTIAAPALEGYNFCNWDVEGDYQMSDEGAVTIPVADLLKIKSLTAVYTPVVTRVELEMDEPAPAAGAKLATGVKALVLTGSDGSKVDLVDAIGEGLAAVTWSPDAEGGVAGYSTAYTALVELMDADGLEGVEKVVASDAEVSVTCAGGAVEAEAAGFTVKDGKLCLAVSFPATADAKVTEISQPTDLELTFEQAKACSELGIWPLASSVDVTVQSGVAAEGDITWQAVEGFDANATAAQELTAHGTVTKIVTADGSKIDDSGLSHEVACKIKVAAPSQDGGNGAASASGSDLDNADNKSALAKTSDSIPVLAVAAVVAIAIAAIAVAIVAARRRRQ